MEGTSFEYGGFLVFKPAIAVVQRHRQSNRERLTPSNLPEFKKGSPSNPSAGFEHEDLERYSMTPSTKDLYHSHIDGVEYFRFKSENYTQEEVFVHDQIQDGYIRNVESTDLFLFQSGLILFRGKKRSVRRTINYIERTNENTVIESIDISPDVLSMLFENPEWTLQNSPISLKRIRSASFAGKDEISNLEMSVGGITSDLRDHFDQTDIRYPESLEAEFLLSGLEMSVKIGGTRIHIRTSDGDLHGEPALMRMVYAVTFSKVLSNILLRELEEIQGDKYGF